jgi:transposase
MANLNIFAGFDVSKKVFDVCIISSDQEQVGCFSYDNSGFQQLLKILPEGAHCVMEATGPYYLKIASWLVEKGFAVSVVNPLVIKRFSQMRLIRAKTDKVDARIIAQYGKSESPDLWEPPAAYLLKLQQLEAIQHQFTKQYSALRCQLHAFVATGIIDKEIEHLLKASIKRVNQQLQHIEERIEQIIQEHHQEMLNNLKTIPGIGSKTAVTLIMISNGFTKFKSYKQLAAYVGISPRIYQSGSSVKGRSRICKMGMSRIRALLYVCAWSAKKYNTGCRDLYQRLVAKGKSKRLALIAVANKLIKQAFAIATTNMHYNVAYVKNICF